MAIEYALSNSFGFGGTNAALLFKRFDSNCVNLSHLVIWLSGHLDRPINDQMTR